VTVLVKLDITLVHYDRWFLLCAGQRNLCLINTPWSFVEIQRIFRESMEAYGTTAQVSVTHCGITASEWGQQLLREFLTITLAVLAGEGPRAANLSSLLGPNRGARIKPAKGSPPADTKRNTPRSESCEQTQM